MHSEHTQNDLTAREMQILGLLAQGLAVREIGKSRAHIEVRPGHHNSLISPAPPEAAWVKFWSSLRLTAAVAVTLMLVVLLRFLHH